jgi:fused signal recognition particle receptor
VSDGIGIGLLIVAGLILLIAAGFLATRVGRKRPRGAAVARPTRREGLGGWLRSVAGRDRVTDEDWARLEETLVKADAGPSASREIVTRVRERYGPGRDPAEVLAQEIATVFQGDGPSQLPEGLAVVMVVGVNGTGKTTTIGKLAHHLKGRREVAVANSDTFRAAAGEQLDTWAQRAGVQVLAGQERGSDPGAVAFDAVKAAESRGKDVLIVDTAGRLQSRKPLMDELSKVRRVIEKAAGRPPHEVLLVLDASTGQNGIAQAREFKDAAGVTGIALTKLDGTAKGGVVVAIREQLGVPVRYVGIGEKIEDLQDFDPKAFAESLVYG